MENHFDIILFEELQVLGKEVPVVLFSFFKGTIQSY